MPTTVAVADATTTVTPSPTGTFVVQIRAPAAAGVYYITASQAGGRVSAALEVLAPPPPTPPPAAAPPPPASADTPAVPFRAQPGQTVRLFRLGPATLRRVRLAQRVRMRTTVVARDLLGNQATRTFGYTLSAERR